MQYNEGIMETYVCLEQISSVNKEWHPVDNKPLHILAHITLKK